MKAFVIYPGNSYSTKDIADNLCYGLRENNINYRPFYSDKAFEFLQVPSKYWKKVANLDLAKIDLSLIISEMAAVESELAGTDTVFIVSGLLFHPILFHVLKKLSKRIITLFTECPYMDEKQLQMVHWSDYCFVNDKVSLEKFKEHNINSFYLPHAFNPSIHQKFNLNGEYQSDIFFIGTAFKNRMKFFHKVEWPKVNIRFYGYYEEHKKLSFMEDIVIPNIEVAKYYNGSKININLHRTDTEWDDDSYINEAYSLNPRTFEIAACGAFQLCDNTRQELFDIFGKTIPTFSDPDDLSKKLRFYLKADDIRDRLAKEAQEKVQEHNWIKRTSEILTIIE